MAALRRAAGAMTIRAQEVSTPQQRQAAEARIGVTIDALPLAMAFDADGHVCGKHSGLLGTDQVRTWVRECWRSK